MIGGRPQNRPYRVSDGQPDQVRSHIISFKQIESHYCRMDFTKLYIPSVLNISKTRHYNKKFYLTLCQTAFTGQYLARNSMCFFVQMRSVWFLDDFRKFILTGKGSYTKCLLQAHYKQAACITTERKWQSKSQGGLLLWFRTDSVLPLLLVDLLFYKTRLNSLSFTVYDFCTTKRILLLVEWIDCWSVDITILSHCFSKYNLKSIFLIII